MTIVRFSWNTLVFLIGMMSVAVVTVGWLVVVVPARVIVTMLNRRN